MAMLEGKRRYGDFVEALEEERRKIQMFSRELPLCLQLVNEAIDNLRWRMEGEEGSCERSVFGDFLAGYSSFRSVQFRGLGAGEEHREETGTLRKPVAVNARRVLGAFQPFERNKLGSPAPIVPDSFVATAVSCSTTTTTGERRGRGGEVEEEEEDERQAPAPTQGNRKQRRCWSPDLHRKFLDALEELGGSHLATPKQIREMMKVDRLTNDEVKSHLQKYRLHTRRPVAAVQSSSSNAKQTSQHFVLLGGIWVPPHDYLAGAEEQPAEGSNGALNDAYFPAASLPLELGLGKEKSAKKQQANRPSVMPLFSQDDDSLLDDAATKSNSSSASVFSQTTTISPSL